MFFIVCVSCSNVNISLLSVQFPPLCNVIGLLRPQHRCDNHPHHDCLILIPDLESREDLELKKSPSNSLA